MLAPWALGSTHQLSRPLRLKLIEPRNRVSHTLADLLFDTVSMKVNAAQTTHAQARLSAVDELKCAGVRRLRVSTSKWDIILADEALWLGVRGPRPRSTSCPVWNTPRAIPQRHSIRMPTHGSKPLDH